MAWSQQKVYPLAISAAVICTKLGKHASQAINSSKNSGIPLQVLHGSNDAVKKCHTDY